jgi:hypothetical protein
MPFRQDGPWLDDAAGRLIRPYTVSGGRTRTTALGLCDGPTSVAEIAAHLRLPAVVTKVLLSDLVDCGALTARQPRRHDNTTDRSLLEAVLDGLRRRL